MISCCFGFHVSSRSVPAVTHTGRHSNAHYRSLLFAVYYTVKVAFLIYLQMPYTRGAEFIYKNYLRSFFNANRHYLESFFGRLRGTANTAASELRGAQSEIMGMATAAALERGVAGLTQRPVQQPDLHRIFGAAPVPLAGGAGAGSSGLAGGKDA